MPERVDLLNSDRQRPASVARYLGMTIAAATCSGAPVAFIVTVLMRADPVQALAVGGISGLVVGAIGAYADRLSRNSALAVGSRDLLRKCARLVAMAAMAVPLLSLLGVLGVEGSDCFGLVCSADQKTMADVYIAFAMIATLMSFGAMMYLRKVQRKGVTS